MGVLLTLGEALGEALGMRCKKRFAWASPACCSAPGPAPAGG